MDKKLYNYAYFRLPEQNHFTFIAQTKGEPSPLQSMLQLDGKNGFVMAPFAISQRHPILLMRPDIVEQHENVLSPFVQEHPNETCQQDAGKANYTRDFAVFHAAVAQGRFSKLVLSRQARTERVSTMTPEMLFHRACAMYPHQNIALVSMRQAGTWLMATPELLLRGKANQWHTMALAGTMRAQQRRPSQPNVVWSEKNLQEQRYVASYIKDILERFADNVSHHGPYTTVAAQLLHLRTDFTFSLRQPEQIGHLLQALHPTPAVCGMPKEDAKAFILDNEHIERKYYSGFCGPLFLKDYTHLLVSLRCMEICHDHLNLYAGGGILPDSEVEAEWDETLFKLQTMRRLLIC